MENEIVEILNVSDLILKLLFGLCVVIGGLIAVIFQSIRSSITKNDIKIDTVHTSILTSLELNNTKFQAQFDTKFKNLEDKVVEYNTQIKQIVLKQEQEILLITRQITLLESELKHIKRRLNKLDGFDSDQY